MTRDVRRSWFDVRRSVRRSWFDVRRSGFVVRRAAHGEGGKGSKVR